MKKVNQLKGFLSAIESNDVNQVKAYLETKNLINQVDLLLIEDNVLDERTALSVAIELGHEALVSVLLAAGADVNQTVSRYHDSQCLQLCCCGEERDGDRFIKTQASPLSSAIMHHHEGIAMLLIEAGADVNFQARLPAFCIPPIVKEDMGEDNAARYPILHIAIRQKASKNMIETLCSKQADKTIKAPYYFNAQEGLWGSLIFVGSFCALIPCFLAGCASKRARHWLLGYRPYTPIELGVALGRTDLTELLSLARWEPDTFFRSNVSAEAHLQPSTEMALK